MPKLITKRRGLQERWKRSKSERLKAQDDSKSPGRLRENVEAFNEPTGTHARLAGGGRTLKAERVP